MSKSKYKSKYFVSLVLCIIGLIALSIFAVFVVKGMISGNKSPVDADSVILSSGSETVIINNKLPVSDEFGRTIKEDDAGYYVYLEFSIKNTLDSDQKYQIYLTKQDVLTDKINEGYIKLYLTDDEDNAFPKYSKNSVPSYVDLYYIKDKADSKNVFEGNLAANEEKKFRFRAWVADNYVVSNKDEAFSFEVGVRAI